MSAPNPGMNHPYGRRRSSIFGALLLLLFGVLLLVHNLAPHLLHLGELIRYWPVLLILWGLARLADHFAASRAGQLPPRTVRAGDLFLIFLAVIALLAFAGYEHAHRNFDWENGWDLFATPYTFTATLPSEPLEPSMQVRLATPRGDITVNPQPEQALIVVVTKTVHSDSQADAEKVANGTRVSFEKTAGGLQLDPRIHGPERVSYNASLFPDISLAASTGDGDLHVSGVQGAVSLAASGQVEVAKAGSNVAVFERRGDVHIHAVKGDVTLNGGGQQVDIGEVTGQVSIDGQFYGPIAVHKAGKGLEYHSRRTTLSVNAPLGRLDVDSGQMQLADTPGNVTLETAEKDLEIEDAEGAVRVVNRDGAVEIRYSRPPRSNIDVTNHSGDIDLFLPGGSAFSVSASAGSGDISSDFHSPSLQSVEQDSNTILKGAIGSGGPAIVLNTTYGTIRIHRAQSAPPPPAAKF